MTNKKDRRSVSPTDSGAYTFHPVTDDVDKPTRDRPHCRVLLLDGEYHTIPVNKKAKAIVVINELFRHLALKDLQEKEFFSVYYVDTSGSKIFLNPFKQIRKQLPNISGRTTWDLFFGVQFYATELTMLADDITRYLYVLQICRDIKEKRLHADNSTKIQLVSLLVQANCGDYDPEEHREGYVEPYIDMIYNQSEIPIGLPNSVTEVHKEKTGFKPNEADITFFMIAKSLYKFGQQIFPVRDRLSQSGEVGASIVGLFFHKDGKEFMNIPWQHVVTVGYRKKKIRVRYHPRGDSDDEIEILYLYCSQPNVKLVWRGCVEQHTFFRLERPIPLVKSTIKSYHSFNRDSELRFSSGRTLYQMLRGPHKPQPTFDRSATMPNVKHTSKRKDNDETKKPEKSPTPPSPIEPDDSGRKSTDSGTLQHKIEEALKKMSEEHLDNTIDTDDPQPIVTTVEINYSDEGDATEEQKQNDTDTDPDVPTLDGNDDPSSLGFMHVEITKSNPDLTNLVEFSTSTGERHNSSFMVTLEETSPSPPPDQGGDEVVFEVQTRNDSIISNDLGPAAQYILEKANPEDGTVVATAVDIEVRTPTPTYDEAKSELMKEELNKLNHVESSDYDDERYYQS